MKRSLISICLLVISATVLFSQEKEFSKLTGSYLGQELPGLKPEIFAPGIVSTVSHEFSCCFSPDGNEFYFARRHPELNQTVIMECKLVNGVWTEPYVAPFVEKSFSFEPFVTPDNKRLYFQSGKPVPGQMGPGMNVLYVDREGDGWSTAKNPGAPFNPMKAMHISSTTNGTIYTTDISGGPGSESLGIINKVNGEYKKLEKLGSPLNKEKLSMHPWIAPDESYMIFGVMQPGQSINSILFITFKNKEGEWSEPIEIKLSINAGQPFVTIDGKYLFFTSGKRGKGDIYWVSTKIIEEFKSKKLKYNN